MIQCHKTPGQTAERTDPISEILQATAGIPRNTTAVDWKIQRKMSV